MYLARKEMAKQAAMASQDPAPDSEGGDDGDGESTEEEGGDLFPISPVGKAKTPFSAESKPEIFYVQSTALEQDDVVHQHCLA